MNPQAETQAQPMDADGGSESRAQLAKADTELSPEDLTCWAVLPGILELWIPIMIAMLLMMVNEFVNVLVIGNLGDPSALAGVGLANMMQNCFGVSICAGIAAGMDTLVSQADGAGEIERTGHYLQRCRAIVTLNMLWVYPLLYCSSSVLTLIGQDPDIAEHAGAYNRASLWGLVLLCQSTVVSTYLRNRQDVVPALGITFITTLLHPIWSVYLVHHCQMGNAGAGYANSLTWWLQYILFVIYLYCSSEKFGLRMWTLLGVEGPGMHGWWSYLEVGLPALLQIGSEMWFWELAALIIGYVGTDALAAHVALANILIMIILVPMSLGFACSTLVGAAIGEGSAIKAKKIVSTGFVMIMCSCIPMAAALALGRSLIPEMYTPDQEIRDLMAPVLLMYSVAIFWESPQLVLGAVLRGLGRTTFSPAITCIMYYAIDLPLLILIGLVLRKSLLAMWIGIMAGALFAFLAFGFALCRTDYQAMVDQAAKASDGHKGEKTA